MVEEKTGQGARRTTGWLDIVAWLGVIGAALLTYASILPWARVQASVTVSPDGPTISGWFLERPRDALSMLLTSQQWLGGYGWFIWTTAITSGVVLGLVMAVWRRSRLAACAYGFWMVVATAGFASAAYAVFGAEPQSLCEVNCGRVELFLARTPMLAFWLAVGALIVNLLGGGARLVSLRRDVKRASKSSVRAMLRSLTEPARAAALIVTMGILIWFFGFIFTPWATQGCLGYPVNWSHFVSGLCSGTDSDGALAYATLGGYGRGSQTFWVEAYALFMMLAALIAVWQRGWAPTVVTLLWAAPTTWLTGVAISGVPALLANPPRLTSAVSNAPWVMGYGPVVSALGLVIVWAGIGMLLWRAVSVWRARTARPSPGSAGAA